MTQRITDAHLEAKIGIINGLLGFENPHPPYSTVGAAHLSGSYGGVDVHFWSNEQGGVSSGMGYHGTKRELAGFLSGMIAALRIAKETGCKVCGTGYFEK